MKQILIKTLLTVAILTYSYICEAQIFKAKVISGFNLSQVDGDETYGFKKIGYTGGLGVSVHVHKNLAFSLETLYSQKGSRLGSQFRDTIDNVPLDGSYKLKLNYAEIPLMFYYTDNIVSAGIGVSYNRLVELGEWRHKAPIDTVTMKSGVFSPNDWIGFGDVSVRVYKNLFANLRYSYSLKKIATRNIRDSKTGNMNIRDFYNNLWSFRIVYMINEQPPKRKPPKDFSK
ncbi:MAG: outer membrane beta-barrel protein [Bacteroidales bacterium]|jgi:hypothetical protein